ncbi:hypothetical protein [Candidatus Marimicrobium litorale]|uniref:Uncharacterized protein n=1 Tax=Candidatus Marimicrobium litorale TaxID=2518991 RepID=A0ABT3TBQ8_9GAMM|nr:hypothetical protein [Candidatus Marimicrobium litorale]MCX2978899.1 hypothetical protein [Candidatus Marimicrobium litorale]
MLQLSAHAFTMSATRVVCCFFLSGAAYAEQLYSWTMTKGVVNIVGEGNQIALGDGSGVDVNRAELRSVSVNAGQLNTITAKIKSDDSNMHVYIGANGYGENGGAFTDWTEIGFTFTPSSDTAELYGSFWKQQRSIAYVKDFTLNGICLTCDADRAPGAISADKLTDTSEAGGLGQVSVMLNSAPSSSVTITAGISDSGEGTITGGSALSFTTSDWNIAQVVEVTGQYDGVCDGDRTFSINLSSASGDSAYDGLATSVRMTNVDDCATPPPPAGEIALNTWIADTPIQIGNGSWLYDAIFPLWTSSDPNREPYTQAALFSDELIAWNTEADARKKINQIFSYGGGPELYCRGSGESAPGDVCDNSNTVVLYGPVPFDKNNTLADFGATGMESAARWEAEMDNAAEQMGTESVIIPIVDGRLDSDAANNGTIDYLNALNRLPQNEAYELADKVAKMYCADGKIAGVQFDLEPFDFTQPGQIHYYTRLAKTFAGANVTNPGDPLDEDTRKQIQCVTKNRPHGISWSVFTFPERVSAAFAAVLNSHGNGYVVISGYDLGSKQGGQVNTPAEYRTLVQEKIQETMTMASRHQVYYQFAIPAAASAHEFEGIEGNDNLGIGLQIGDSGHSQLEYVQIAVEEMKAAGMENDPYFIGTAVWGWSERMIWPPGGETEFFPNVPQADVISYLQANMPVPAAALATGETR